MAILPVSSFNTNTNYNINFGNKKPDNQSVPENRNVSSPMKSSAIKAVPLALLLAAMGPVSVNNNNINAAENVIAAVPQGRVVAKLPNNWPVYIQKGDKIVSSKVFPLRTPINKDMQFCSLNVCLINSKGGPGFDKVYIYSEQPDVFSAFDDKISTIKSMEYWELSGLNQCYVQVISDDGVNQGTFTTKNLVIYRDGEELPCDEVYDYIVQQLAKNPKKNIIKQNSYTRQAGISSDGLSRKVNGNIIDKSTGINLSNCTKIENSFVVLGDSGHYTISFYKDKSTGAKIATLVRTSNPRNAFKIGLVLERKAIINPNAPTGQIIPYPDIILLDGQGKQIHLCDSVLAEELKKIANKKYFGVMTGFEDSHYVGVINGTLVF